MHAPQSISAVFVALMATSLLTAQCLAAAHIPADSARERIDRLEPKLVAFVEHCDQLVVSQGRPLTAQESELARRVGVSHPERVRILVSDDFPQPDDPQFTAELRELGPGNPVAETTGYGIQLTPRVASSRRTLAHELTHVGQVERWGIAAFMKEYLTEMVTVGYRNSPLEAEARANEGL